MGKLSTKSKTFIKRNASTILTYAGAAGVVATTVTAVKVTPKALLLLEDAKREKGEDLTKLEVINVTGPLYIPTVLFGVSSIACIFGANVLNKRQQAALMSAYALLNNSYKEYKDKVQELLGKDGEQEIVNEIAKDKYVAEEDSEDDGLELFYDQYSGRYFRSTKYKVQRAIYELNRDLVMRDYAYLNEYYEYLELEPIDSGWTLGWSTGGCMDQYWQQWLDFGYNKVVMDDGMECTIINMLCEPLLDFGDYA